MGVFAQSPLSGARREAGMALVASIIALGCIGLLVTGMFVMTDLHRRSALNREGAARAAHVAEAGLTHGLALLRDQLRNTSFTNLLRGSDGLAATTADNGYLAGYGLTGSFPIPSGGRATTGGTYFVQVLDDPAETDGNLTTDSNGKVLLRCSGRASDGAEAAIEAIVYMTMLAGVVTDGPLTMPGDPTINGACGNVHANGNLTISGTPNVNAYASTSGTANVSGSLENLSGIPIPPLTGQPLQDVPTLNPMDHCAAATYKLQADGFILVVATGQLLDARSTDQLGWKRSSTSPLVWDQSASVSPGTVCATGNVKIGGTVGSAASPLSLSIIATGSIEISGNPYITPAHPDNVALLAGGDLSFSGNPAVGSQNYSGLMYAGSQCRSSGNPAISGQLVCNNEANPAGSINYVDQNEINGNPTITFNCNSNLLNKRRVLFWYPKFGI